MFRLLLALVVVLGCVPVAPAMFAPEDGAAPGKDLSRQLQLAARAPEPTLPLVITGDTEIKVDGRACRLEQVPAGAVIILLDVGADRTVIQRIHFQTRKCPQQVHQSAWPHADRQSRSAHRPSPCREPRHW